MQSINFHYLNSYGPLEMSLCQCLEKSTYFWNFNQWNLLISRICIFELFVLLGATVHIMKLSTYILWIADGSYFLFYWPVTTLANRQFAFTFYFLVCFFSLLVNFQIYASIGLVNKKWSIFWWNGHFILWPIKMYYFTDCVFKFFILLSQCSSL